MNRSLCLAALAAALAALGAACACPRAATPPAATTTTTTETATTATAPTPAPLGVAPAPISFDGHVAGRATDVVLVLVPDADPATPGIALQPGEALHVALPAALARDAAVAISADTDANLVLTRGWPQGAIKLPGRYAVAYDDAAHALAITAINAVGGDAADAPGIKAIHLRGKTFVNPAAGAYPVTIEHRDAAGAARAAWTGTFEVAAAAPAARLAPTNFHLPPGTNANFQRLAPGQTAPLRLGLLLWGAGGAPLDGVGVAPRDLARFPQYTGGLLVQDTNGDHALDPAVDRVVGGIIGAAPAGATGQAATSPLDAAGRPLLSGEVVRDAGHRMAGGQPNPGLLVVEFRAGDLPGRYQPTFALLDGNQVQLTIVVEAR